MTEALAAFRTWAYEYLADLMRSGVRNQAQEQTMRAVIHRLHAVQDTEDLQCPNCCSGRSL